MFALYSQRTNLPNCRENSETSIDLGDNPKPEEILGLKICDPTMGSGAFLVETCRQLADELVKLWHFHDHPNLKDVDPGEGEIL